jgi:leucyl aminopeptidase
LAETAQRIAHDHEHMHATVLDRAAIEAKGFMLLAAVGRGSSDHHESRFIHLVYKPHGEVKRKVAFVGKGVTFDTGGYCIKPAAGMYGMHGDMGGAAAVLGAAESIGRLQPADVEIHFLVPSTANMINGDAFLLNEIIRGYGGKTVEINNTDAEGRLILADALAYAVELGVDEIVDLATLTGACVVALGDYYTGLFSNNDAAARKVLDASAAAGERVWQMPLDERLRDKLKSGVADMKNTGDRNGGAITAALFLREWVGDKPWVHLDIAGPALAEGDTPLYPRGGTGVGVTTLVRLVS